MHTKLPESQCRSEHQNGGYMVPTESKKLTKQKQLLARFVDVLNKVTAVMQ
jgi:hypothetical protein